MANRSKRIEMLDREKLKLINKETIKLFEKYKIDMTIRELSPKSIYNYVNDLENWVIYILDNQDNKSVAEIGEEDITEFIYFCKLQGNNSRRIKRRLSSISAFYKFLRKKRIITENPMEFIDRPKKDTSVVQQNFLTKEQVLYMKEKVKENGDLQLEVFVNLALSTMARINAISNIQWKQIDFERRIIEDVLEKEQRVVVLFFNSECKELLLKLKEERNKSNINCDYVFITNYGQEYSNASVTTLHEWTKKVGSMIGIPSLHNHDYRHSSSNLLLQAGMPIEDISNLLHHLGVDVTIRHYTRPDAKKIQAQKDKYDI